LSKLPRLSGHDCVRTLSKSGFYQKRLMVKPGHVLSLQLHRKRAEHWVVVSGRARVTRGEDDIERFEDRYNRG
jgi:mannose-6-phosphate isomerase-like protein (cupin superfamily)